MANDNKFGLNLNDSHSRLDAEFSEGEIDHGFFDNPCATFELDEGTSNFSESYMKAPPYAGGVTHAQLPKEFSLNLDISSHSMVQARGQELVTPETCVPSSAHARFEFPPSSVTQDSSNTDCKKLEEQDEDISGPHSSFFNLLDEADMHGQAPQDDKGSDVSSSISSSSDDEYESDNALDTEDEEFVEMLRKYYKCMDLEDSSSDLTEVSPMSSFSESPHPSLCVPTTEAVESSHHLDPVYKRDETETNLVNRVGRSRSMILANEKPLPPLIIHTLEDVPIIRADMAVERTQGFQEPRYFPTSLLMTVKPAVEGPSENGTRHEEMSYKDDSDANTFSNSQSVSSRNASEDEKDNINDTSGAETFSDGDNAGQAKLDKTKKNSTNHAPRSGNRGHANHLAHVKGTIQHHRFGYHHQPIKASATIARQRLQRRIEQENSILVRRLQNVKPSKEIVEAFRPGTGTSHFKCPF